jgi:hypothetical protein
MSQITSALGRAFASLAHPRMLFLMIWPIVAALVLWTFLAFAFGTQLLAGAEGWLAGFSLYQRFAVGEPWATITTVLLWILGFILWVPLVLITASLIIGVVSMPMMVRHVAERDYPTLEKRAAGGVAGMASNVGGSVWNAIVALAFLAILAVVTLPLWLIPPLWPFIPVALFGWFNQRLFRYDALAEHGTPEEMRTIFKAEGGRMWVLGIVLALIGHIPVLGFFMPVLAGLAFIHYGFARLAELRAARPGAVVPAP